MPGPGGNRGKKRKGASYARYREGYGKLVPAKGINPGAEVYEWEKRSSDAIRTDMSPSFKGWGSHNSKTRYGR